MQKNFSLQLKALGVLAFVVFFILFAAPVVRGADIDGVQQPVYHITKNVWCTKFSQVPFDYLYNNYGENIVAISRGKGDTMLYVTLNPEKKTMTVLETIDMVRGGIQEREICVIASSSAVDILSVASNTKTPLPLLK